MQFFFSDFAVTLFILVGRSDHAQTQNASVVGNILVEWHPTSGWLKDHVRVGPMPPLASFGLSAMYIHHRRSIIVINGQRPSPPLLSTRFFSLLRGMQLSFT